MAEKTVIFNIQFDYRSYEGSGSSNRPRQMRQAFEQRGFEVIEISGVLSHRAIQVAELIPRLGDLGKAMLYAESSTAPHLIDESTRRPAASPDIKLAQACAQAGIPSALFYRDMHWRFVKPGNLKQRIIQAYYRRFYKKEIRLYAEHYGMIYGPTLGLLKAAPEFEGKQLKALPPGAPLIITTLEYVPREGFVHVGGITGPKGLYDMRNLVEACSETAAGLSLICREEDWLSAQAHYPASSQTYIVHASGPEKDKQLLRSKVGLLVYAPHPYRALAFPFKLLEYLATGLPILATAPSEAATFIEQHNIGWTCGSDRESIAKAIQHITDHPEEIQEKAGRLTEMFASQTWEARVEQIESDLWRP